MKRYALLLIYAIVLPATAQDYSYFTNTILKLYSASADTKALLWDELARTNRIPFVYEDSVAFLYKGEAQSVMWMGDFNGWGYDKNFNNKGINIPGSDLWIHKTSFPRDARLDYKVVVNENNWMLDPFNKNLQLSGVGGGSPNSELRMSAWKPDTLTTTALDNIRRGKVEKDLLFNSKALGYQVMYSVYLPSQYNPQTKYPVIYVTDGYEYIHEQMGNMVTVLDNLIGIGKIKPVIAVFIDHREPVNRSNNRRMQELALNDKYFSFITEELIPVVEKEYSIINDPAQRAILGTSMGGLTAAYFAFSKPEVFGLAGIQSPAFWFKPDIYKLCDNPDKPPVKTFMTTGTINDTEEGARKMKSILEKNTCTFAFMEVNQGHSWGNWRDLLDDILIYFYATN